MFREKILKTTKTNKIGPNWFNSVRMGQDRSKYVQMDPNGSTFVQMGQLGSK